MGTALTILGVSGLIWLIMAFQPKRPDDGDES